MKENVSRFLEKLKTMNGTELKAAYIKVFGERPHGTRHEWLRNRIAWGYQAKLEQGMSQRFMDYALQHADLSELRTFAPRSSEKPRDAANTNGADAASSERPFSRDPRIPKPGTVLARDFKGSEIKIKILEHGFEWNGMVFSSFSKAVKTATGASYSPFVFFKLGPNPKN